MSSAGRILCLAALWIVATAQAAPLELSERVEYRIAWNGIPAAHAVIEVRRDESSTDPQYEVVARGRTTRFIDIFWKFRAEARAQLGAPDFSPRRFAFERTESSTHRLTRIAFDEEEKRADGIYMRRGITRSEVSFDSENLFDPISAMMRARFSDADVGSVLGYEIFTGETRYRVEFHVLGRESISVPAGTFDAFRIVPHVWRGAGENREVDNKRLHDATIWVADNDQRTVLRAKTHAFVGSVTLDLVRLGANTDTKSAPEIGRRHAPRRVRRAAR